MPPLSQLMQMGPGNVFGGLGKGLGAGIGGGITKQIRRPLFNKLADKYVKGKEGMAEQAALSTLGLTQAPEAGAPQYENFMMQMNQALAPAQGRADTARALWEQDPDAANKYLLAESTQDKRKAAGKLTKAELVGSPAARTIMMQIDEIRKKMVEPGLAPQEFASLQVEKQGLMDKFFGVTGHNLSDQTFNQYRDLYLTPEKKEKEKLDIDAKSAAAADRVLKEAQTFAEKKITNAKADKLVNQANQLSPAVARIQNLTDSFDAVKEDPSSLFAAVKSLAQIIEPGLQVTEGEARAFLGETAVQRFVQTLNQGGEAASTAIRSFFNMDDTAAAAAYDSPKQLWELLVMASNMASATQSAYQGLLEEIPLRAMAASDANIQALFTSNAILSPDKKDAIQKSVDTNISLAYPTITPVTPLPYGTPMPGAGPQFDANGNEISQTDEPGDAGDAQRAAAAKKDAAAKKANTQSKIANTVIDKAIDDFLE